MQTSSHADKLDVLEVFGRDLIKMKPCHRKATLDLAVKFWRQKGFPYPRVKSSEIIDEFNRLSAISADHILVHGQARVVTTGLRLANYFHPQMWRIPLKGRSPIDCFEDDYTLRRCLEKSMRFYPNRRCWNAQCLRSILRLCYRSRVSNFRPAVARALYLVYLNEGGNVLDFAAGFGGRMLGAMTIPCNYVGIEPSVEQIRGLKRMQKRLCSHAPGETFLYRACAEDLMPSMSKDSFDLILTSPPYFDNEKYSKTKTQSYRRYPHYTKWRDSFMWPVLEQSYRLLKPGGHLLLNVANTSSYPIADDALVFAKKLFKHIRTIHMLIPSLPHHRSNGNKMFRSEPIFVMKEE